MTDEAKAKLAEWLNEKVGESATPRHERIAHLVACNRGFTVHQWGVIDFGIGPFQRGLLQPDALELMYYGAFLDGVVCVAGDPSDILEPLINDHVERVVAAYGQEHPEFPIAPTHKQR